MLRLTARGGSVPLGACHQPRQTSKLPAGWSMAAKSVDIAQMPPSFLPRRLDHRLRYQVRLLEEVVDLVPGLLLGHGTELKSEAGQVRRER
jgi:hypothetical protein